MASDVQIRFKATSAEVRREIDQLKKEVQELRQQLGQTQRTANPAEASVDKLGDEAREATIGVTSLGRNIFKTSAEAKRFGVYFRMSRVGCMKRMDSMRKREKRLINLGMRRGNLRGKSACSVIRLRERAEGRQTSRILQMVRVADHKSSLGHSVTWGAL